MGAGSGFSASGRLGVFNRLTMSSSTAFARFSPAPYSDNNLSGPLKSAHNPIKASVLAGVKLPFKAKSKALLTTMASKVCTKMLWLSIPHKEANKALCWA